MSHSPPDAEVLTELRVLLTDAFVLLQPDKAGHDVHVDGSLARVWREKYAKLVGKLGNSNPAE